MMKCKSLIFQITLFFALLVLSGCQQDPREMNGPLYRASEKFSNDVNVYLKNSLRYVYFDKKHGTYFVPIMIPDNATVILNGENINAADVGKKLLEIETGFSPETKLTYYINLAVHPDVTMRVVSVVKEQMKSIGAIRLFYRMLNEDEKLRLLEMNL